MLQLFSCLPQCRRVMRWTVLLACPLLPLTGWSAQLADQPAAALGERTETALCPSWPLVIAHRGDSGNRPEHTASAYWRAMQQGADFIEVDLVLSKDGVLISRHENELSVSTNVADLPAFVGRKTSKMIDGVSVTGWFSEDFTLAELRQLKARESKPQARPANQQFNDSEGLLTFAEVLSLLQRFEQQTGRAVGLYVETKHPSYFAHYGRTSDGQAIARDLTVAMLKVLAPWQRHNRQPVYIQSFEISNLVWLRQQGLQQYQVNAKLIQLIGDISGKQPADSVDFAIPADVQQSGVAALQGLQYPQSWQAKAKQLDYSALVSTEGLVVLSQYADGIGPWKDQWFSRQGERVVAAQHHAVLAKHGLWLHPYTYRAEAVFLPAGVADLTAELSAAFAAGVDGVFTDHPALALTARQQLCQGSTR